MSFFVFFSFCFSFVPIFFVFFFSFYHVLRSLLAFDLSRVLGFEESAFRINARREKAWHAAAAPMQPNSMWLTQLSFSFISAFVLAFERATKLHQGKSAGSGQRSANPFPGPRANRWGTRAGKSPVDALFSMISRCG